ncbi:MAG TPA: NF038120 family PEP-CTERM protein [Janthinobacterium sp.]|nr:NF038120 family PEP-CTERM protein [Janthinobacterium sp.]
MNYASYASENSVEKLGLSVRKLFAAVLLGAAFSAMPAAHAGTIDFEGIGNGLVGDSDTFQQAGLYLTAYSNAIGAQPGDLVGAVVDGSDLGGGLCVNLACPGNNSSNFYTGLNDGYLQLDVTNPANHISILGFDASFIGAIAGGSYPAVSGLLQIQGFFADGSSDLRRYALSGPVGGSFNFEHFITDTAFASENFAAVDVFAYSCDASGNCLAFQDNKGQFAIDNIAVTVPEPSTYLMMLLGLASVGAAALRRRSL